MVKFCGLMLCCLVIFAAGCKKDALMPPHPEYRNYFPANVGNWYQYECDSFYYNDFTGKIDSFHFSIKEVYESAFIDNSGREAIRLERWKRERDSVTWQLKDVWHLVKTNRQVEKTEEDQRYLKLLFPVREGIEWNLNALNGLPERTVEYKDVHKPFQAGPLQFDSTITVENTDPTNLVNEYRTTETYAAGVGLISRKLVDVRYEIPGPAIRSGVVFTMQLRDWKK